MTSADVRPHRRQFVLWRQPVRASPDWRCIDLGADGVLSHCPDLDIARLHDREGTAWTLLGIALSTEVRHATPASLIAATPTRDVPEATADLAGRWLLIGASHVYPDATCLLGCLYTRDDAGRLVVTASPALAATVGRAEPATVADPRRLVARRGISWFPPPGTRFDGVARLLPTQCLDLATGTPRPRALLPPVPEANAETRLDAITERLATTLSRLPTLGTEIHLGLSAGQDCRAVLAVAVAAGVRLSPFTRIGPRVPVADRLLPPTLAAAAGLDHRYLREATATGDRTAMLEAHAAGSVAPGEVGDFLQGSRDALQGVMTNGGGFELISGSAIWRRLPAGRPTPDRAAAAIAGLRGEPTDGPAVTGLRHWLDWTERHPVPGLDWRDRIFLEQRRCGWQAAKEQVYDMQDLRRVPVLNAARTWALMLALPERLRLGGGVQRALMARCCPALLDLPVNPPDRAFLLDRPDLVLASKAREIGRRLLAFR